MRETKDSGIELGNIPFVKLRTILSQSSLKELRTGVEELVEAAQSEVTEAASSLPKLVIDLTKKKATYGGQPIKLEPAKLTFLAYYADRKKNHCLERGLDQCGDCRACFQADGDLEQEQNRYFQLIRAQYPERQRGSAEEKILRMKNAFDYPYDLIKATRSLTNKATANVSRDLEIIGTGERGETCYGIALDKTLIELVSVSPTP